MTMMMMMMMMMMIVVVVVIIIIIIIIIILPQDIFLWTTGSEDFRNTAVFYGVPFEMRGESKTLHFHYKQ
jgi:uncharacterized membrane protein YqiK